MSTIEKNSRIDALIADTDTANELTATELRYIAGALQRLGDSLHYQGDNVAYCDTLKAIEHKARRLAKGSK